MAETNNNGLKLLYSITDVPPIHICILLGFQQFMTAMGGIIAMPLIVSEAACFGKDLVGRAELMATVMLVNGIATFIQVTIGCRLPILQGPSFAFAAPIVALGSVEAFRCPSDTEYANETMIVGSDEHRELWMSRMTVLQGAVILSGLFEIFIGATGLIGVLFHYIGPLTIAPTTALLGLGLVEEVFEHYASKHWPIALMALILVLIFSLFLSEVLVPLPSFSFSLLKSPRHFKFEIRRRQIFGLFPVLAAILTSWAVCAILTAANVFPDRPTSGYGYSARTDIRTSQISAAPWFRIPYPGQWGVPKVFIATVLGMFASTFASVVESIGDYSACARMCRVPRPPPHAVNRGIAAEGLACMIAGFFGTGPGVTSYSENIGAIGITSVASRSVLMATAGVFILMGCVTKISSIFVSIPDPVIGGTFIASFAMLSSVGFSNLQFVDLNSSRNLFILGISMFMGLGMPLWVKHNPRAITTGSDIFDQILQVLLSTGMLVGGGLGFLMDNIVPGATRKQRGLDLFEEGLSRSETIADLQQAELARECYNLPLVSKWINNVPFLRFIPICPTFKPKYLSQMNIFGVIRKRIMLMRTSTSGVNLAELKTTQSSGNMQNAGEPTEQTQSTTVEQQEDGIQIKIAGDELGLNMDEAHF